MTTRLQHPGNTEKARWSREGLRPFSSWSVFALICLLTSPACGARLLQVYLEADDRTILHTFYQDDGRAKAAAIWRYLKAPPIMVDENATSISVGTRDPLLATVQGNLILRVQHKERVIARASLSTLTLRREERQSQAWFLPAAEVERTAAVAGLGPAHSLWERLWSHTALPVFMTLVVLVVAIALTALALLRFRGGRKPATEP